MLIIGEVNDLGELMLWGFNTLGVIALMVMGFRKLILEKER
jgi:hypothetical protein